MSTITIGRPTAEKDEGPLLELSLEHKPQVAGTIPPKSGYSAMTAPPFDAGGNGALPLEGEKKKRRSEPAGPREVTPEDRQTDEPLPQKYSEDRAAQRFSEQHKDNLRFVSAWGKWLQWEGARWKVDGTLLVYDLARAKCRQIADEAQRDPTLDTEKLKRSVAQFYGSAKTVAAVERLAKAARTHAAEHDEWDTDIWALNTPSGIVNLRDGSISPSDRARKLTKITGCAPADDSNCPKWLDFLNIITAGDEELQKFLQRIAGYSMTGNIAEHALFFLYGTGRNGKGTFLGVLRRILGDYALTAGMDVFIEQRGVQHPTELANLMGARLVTAQETEQGRRWAESRLKALTGGDPITARFMRQDFFTYMPQFKLLIAGNHKPRLRNVDEAIKARMNLVPFTTTIPLGERIKDFDEKLVKDEGTQIMRWFLEGCLAWQDQGLAAPKSVKDATDRYLAEQDTLAEWIAQECVQGHKLRGLSSKLYKSYAAFTEKSSEPVLSITSWKEKLASRNLDVRKSDGNICVIGLDLREQPMPQIIDF